MVRPREEEKRGRPSALGALAALEKNNKNDVMVYGIDGTPEIKALIGRNQMIVGTVACKWMINIVKKGKLIYFAIYCAIAGAVTIACTLM